MRTKILFLLVFLFTFLSYNNNIHAQCPRGKVNCEGECGRFIDEDGDGHCDLPFVGKEKPKRQSSQQDVPQIKANPKKIEPKKQVEDTSDKELIIDSLVPEIIIDGEDTVVEAVVVSRAGRIKRITHRKIWNSILLITFLMSCLLGFLLVIQINYDVLKSLYLLNLKIHVEFGIAMTLVAIIHILWHLTYFKKLIRTKKTTPGLPNE